MKFHSLTLYIIQEHSIKIQILRYHFGISFKNIIFQTTGNRFLFET